MRKRVVSILLTAAMSAMLFTGCSTPTEAPASSAKEETKAEEDTKSSSSGLSAATVLDVSQLPVTGIGAQIATSVKAGGDYKIGYIARTQRILTWWLSQQVWRLPGRPWDLPRSHRHRRLRTRLRSRYS